MQKKKVIYRLRVGPYSEKLWPQPWKRPRSQFFTIRTSQPANNIYLAAKINLPDLLLLSDWPYLELMLCCWFDFCLDYHYSKMRKMSQNKTNNSLAAMLQQVDRGLSTRTRIKMKEFAFESIQCCLQRLYWCLETLNWRKKLHTKQESNNTRDKFAFKLIKTMQLSIVFFVNILSDFLSHVVKDWRRNKWL